VLELEVPVGYLHKLFRNEQSQLEKFIADFIDSVLQPHFKELGRSKSKGPDRVWLLTYAKSYLQNFIMEIGNRVIEAHTADYGDLPIGYIDKWKVYEKTIVIYKYKDGTFGLGYFGLQGRGSFNLSGEYPEWSPGLLQISQPENYPTHPYDYALRRVRMLSKAGLHMEALCLLNAFLEVNIKDTLSSCIRSTPEDQETLENMNHRTRLEILRKITKLADDDVIRNDDSYHIKIENAVEIYKHRNDYVHALKLPERDGYLSIKQRRYFEKLMYGFVDVHESQQWLLMQMRIADGEDSMAVKITQEAARRWRESRQ
jgi:hypothetical protein